MNWIVELELMLCINEARFIENEARFIEKVRYSWSSTPHTSTPHPFTKQKVRIAKQIDGVDARPRRIYVAPTEFKSSSLVADAAWAQKPK